jgi:hypothetical protein
MKVLRTHSSNTVSMEFLILLSINNSIAKISLYELSRPKFNFGGYMISELTFKAFRPHDFALYLLQIIDRWVTQFHILFCLLFASKMRNVMETVFEFVYAITPFLLRLTVEKLHTKITGWNILRMHSSVETIEVRKTATYWLHTSWHP